MANSQKSNEGSCFNQNKGDKKSFIPRDYQVEIFEEARKKNTIACLGTGTGKTFIAVMLIRDNASAVRLPFSEGGKRIFFLVPTVPLVYQQMKTIKDHTDLRVKGYHGSKALNSWSKNEWTQEFANREVLVMTAEIFRIILVQHGFIKPTQIQLIIFDECHRAQKKHPYVEAMKFLHDVNKEDLPRIFGLSASLLNGKCQPSQLEKHLKKLESTMLSTITTASDLGELRKYGTDPDEFVVFYSNYESSTAYLVKEIDEFRLQQEKRKAEAVNFTLGEDITFFSEPLKVLNSLEDILNALGPWCALKCAKKYKEEIDTLLQFSSKTNFIEPLQKFLNNFMEKCSSLNDVDFKPHKLQRLIEIFSAAHKSSKFTNNDPPVEIDFAFEDDPEGYHKLVKENNAKKKNGQICSIVFVKERITAYVLKEWLLKEGRRNPDISYIKPEYLVGHGTTGLADTSMKEKEQRKTLKAFKNQECNVLVATNVVEEGLDVGHCNFVVRFDLPDDFRSYVQSKGRARAKNSMYVLLVRDGTESFSFIQDICTFKTLEQLLLYKCRNRDELTEEDILENTCDDEIPPYMPYGINGPRITMSSAIPLIYHFCQGVTTTIDICTLWISGFYV